MRAPRPYTSSRAKGLPKPLGKIILRCSTEIDDELIAAIDFYAEIKDSGKELLRSNGHTNLADVFARFQAYIRQAKTFYAGAKVLSTRASPLNYYYAFMNLAKALILLHTPNFVDSRLTHGLIQRAQIGSLRTQKINATTHGVFPSFYRVVTGHTLATALTIRAVDLLGYISDVVYEYKKLRYGNIHAFPTRLAIKFNKPTNTVCALIAVTGGKIKDFGQTERALTKTFDSVDVSYDVSRNIFQTPGEEHPTLGYFETKADYPAGSLNNVITNIFSELHDFISLNPFNDDHAIVLNRRIKTPRHVPMNETLAIYGFMFFLGSLVRYRPDILESMLSTKDAWLIERFTKAAPITFLRHVRNLFDKEYLVFTQR